MAVGHIRRSLGLPALPRPPTQMLPKSPLSPLNDWAFRTISVSWTASASQRALPCLMMCKKEHKCPNLLGNGQRNDHLLSHVGHHVDDGVEGCHPGT